MTTRNSAPVGAPCWTDLWTSDVEGSRRFYSELFGWEAAEPSEEFGGYFMFLRDGVPVAGGMGDMGDMAADNTWKIYLATKDIAATSQAVASTGGDIAVPSMPIADLGSQLVFTDSSGAAVGAWQAETFPGFTVINEPGAPSWFELYTRDQPGAVSFYSELFGLESTAVSDTDEFRYSTLQAPGQEAEPFFGIMAAGGFLPEGAPAHWVTYWEVDDVDAAFAKVSQLGGSLGEEPTDTPYGRMASVADPAGAQFKLRTGPR